MLLKNRYISYFLKALFITICTYFLLFSGIPVLRIFPWVQIYPTNIFGLELRYLIKNNCTKDSSIKAIHIVTSYVEHFKARYMLRKAYPREELEKLGIFRVFLLAMPKPGASDVIQKEIVRENEIYNDIVQGNFYEDYRNLTYKHIMGILWTVTECESDYIIKMDDDIVPDMYFLTKLIDSKKNDEYDILANVFNTTKPIRDKYGEFGKWFVSEDEYKSEIYPAYASGWLYVIKVDAAKKILHVLKNETFFWVDDVFVTGILAEKAKLRFENMGEYFVYSTGYFECCMRDTMGCGIVAGPGEGNYDLLVDFQKHSKLCFETKCPKYTNDKKEYLISMRSKCS